MSMELRGTTICAVRKNGHTSIAGDGQVTMGQSVIFKSHAHKVRRLYGGQVVIGFAGAVADAFTLCDKFEEKLTQCGGNLERAAVALAQMWRSDSGMRQLETQMIVADKDTLLVVSGTGEVIDPDEGVVAIGSGGNSTAPCRFHTCTFLSCTCRGRFAGQLQYPAHVPESRGAGGEADRADGIRGALRRTQSRLFARRTARQYPRGAHRAP